jgi:hypothetical protein
MVDDEGEEVGSCNSCAGCGQEYRVGESDAAMGVIFCGSACEAIHFEVIEEEIACRESPRCGLAE